MTDQEIPAPQPATPATPAAPEIVIPAPQRPARSFGFGRQGGRRPGGFRPGGRGRQGRYQEKPEYQQKTLDIARVARVTKGGKRFSFRSTIVIGDGKGKVGVGIAKGKDVAQSIQKAYNQARKRLITVPIVNGTIPYEVHAKYSSAVVMLKPSRRGVKAGGPVRVVAQLAGIRSLTGKLIERTNNKVNIAMAALKALSSLRVREKAATQNP